MDNAKLFNHDHVVYLHDEADKPFYQSPKLSRIMRSQQLVLENDTQLYLVRKFLHARQQKLTKFDNKSFGLESAYSNCGVP